MASECVLPIFTHFCKTHICVCLFSEGSAASNFIFNFVILIFYLYLKSQVGVGTTAVIFLAPLEAVKERKVWRLFRDVFPVSACT